jgi:hypothetical protein
VAGLAAIAGPNDTFPVGTVPRSWLRTRLVGEATVARRFADVNHAESLAYLQRQLAARLVHYGISELDGAAVRLTTKRRLTQEISSHLYALADGVGEPLFAGIAYRSRFGDNYHNWAIFERPQDPDILQDRRVAEIDSESVALQAALNLLDLRLDG